jgi:G3E family GTPase
LDLGGIPVVIVSGFLGSGKTTLLRRSFADPGDPGTAIVINEFGEVGLDHRLVRAADEDTVLVGGGCACCARRMDLVRALGDLLDERQRGRRRLDRVVIETSGLADPAPIAFTITTDAMLKHHFRLERVVVAVDAVNGWSQLERQPESRKQALVADELVITKADLVDAGAARALADRLRALNPAAGLRTAVDGDVGNEPLASPQGGPSHALAAAAAAVADGGGDGDGADHTGDVRTLTFVQREPLDWLSFAVWLSMLLHARGDNVLRVKGVLALEGGQRVNLNGVQHVIHPPEHLAADAIGDDCTRLIFIARGADPALIRRSLELFQGVAGNRPEAG